MDYSLLDRTAEHLGISAMAILIAAIIAIPLGIYIGHTGKGAGFIGAFTGSMRAIPVLGLITLFGLVVGIGVAAPLLALIILAIPSLLAGTYAGIRAVDRTIVDASYAQGMSTAQVLSRVEVPLALPSIVGGIRTATLQVIATATLAAYSSDIGLGRLIFAGLKTRNYEQMAVGSIAVIVLAFVVDSLFALGEKRLTRLLN